MTTEKLCATTTINAPAEALFGVLADPSTHQAIDGTGWVREPIDSQHLTVTGQIFPMAMYHDNHPDGDYQMSNKVVAYESPTTIAWEPGQAGAGGELEFGGWIWRYDLEPTAPNTTRVTLTYDWSEVPDSLREHIQFPPFDPSHLDNSLRHLAQLVNG